MKRFAVLAIAVALLSPLAAAAGESGNTYVEVGGARVNSNSDWYGPYATFSGRPHRNAAYVKGSWEFTPGLYVFGEHSHGTSSTFGTKSNTNQLGLGYTRSLNESTAVLAEGSYIGSDNDVWDSSGGRLSAGLRTQFSPRLEGWAKTHYSFASGYAGDGTYSLSAGGQVKFTPTWGLTSEIERSTYSTEYKLGVRASF